MQKRRLGEFIDGVAELPGGKGRIRIRVAGKLIKATFPTMTEAKVYRYDLRARAAAQRLGIEYRDATSAAPKVISLREAFNGHIGELKKLRRSPKTISEAEDIRDLWLDWRGEGSAALTRRDLVDFVDWLLSRPGNRSKGARAKKAISIVRTVMRRADLPVPAAPVVEVPERRQKTVSLKKARAFLESMAVGSVARTYAEIVIRTHCRESEARRLRFSDVDLADGVLSLPRKKGRAGRRQRVVNAPILPGLRKHLEEYLKKVPEENRKHDRYLLTGTKQPLEEQPFRYAFTRASKAAGISPPKEGVGWLRNQAATIARIHGTRLSVVAAGLGDSEEVARRHYDESSAEWREVAEAVEAELERELEKDDKGGAKSGTPHVNTG